MNPMSEQEFEDYVRQANWFMRGQIEQNQKDFKLDTFPRFDWDQWRGELVFSSGGMPKVVARIQVVGTLSTKANTWLWSWANSTLLEPVRQAVLRAKEFGTERGLLRLIQPKWAAREKDAWEMTAVTGKLTEAKGAFRCPSPDGFTFMVFTDLRAATDRKRIFGARSCSHVLDDDRPILLVSREKDGEIFAVCGSEEDSTATMRDTQFDRLISLDPSLTQLAGLPDGWMALRESPDDDWTKSKAE